MCVLQNISMASIFLILWSEVSSAEYNQTVEALWNLTSYALQSRQRYLSYNNELSHLYGAPFTNREHLSENHQNPQLYAANYQKFIQNYRPHSQRPNFNEFSQQTNMNYGIYGTNSKYPHHPIGNYGQYGYPQKLYSPGRPNIGYPQPNYGPLSFLPSRESFMGALDSIARNDELHCVPRILCEVTSGTLTARQSGFQLPFNINMESIVGLLAGLNGLDTNPLLSFGKAALLGYSSRGNAGTCMYAYPQCPRDPERLVEYLNNYNGGFFRFFNGLNPHTQQFGNGQFPVYNPQVLQQRPQFNPNFQSDAQSYGLYNPYRRYNYKVNKVEKRILTKPSEFIYTSNRFPDNRQQKGIKFPDDIDESDNEINPPYNFHSHNGDSLRTLKFPISGEDTFNGPFRKPKQLSDFYEANFQRPSPHHRPTPMIFPDRTGTGELKFTPEELSDNYSRPSALQNNNLISFNSETNNDPFYYINSDPSGLRADSYDFNRQNNRFFPS